MGIIGTLVTLLVSLGCSQEGEQKLEPVSQIRFERMMSSGELKSEDEVFVLVELVDPSNANRVAEKLSTRSCAGRFCQGRIFAGELAKLTSDDVVVSVSFLGRAEPASGRRFDRGVLVGVIDKDFFWRNAGFWDDGWPRVVYLWDQINSLGPGPSFLGSPYGTELSSAQLRSLRDDRILLPNRFGHGFIMSHIAGADVRSGETTNRLLLLPAASQLILVNTLGGDYQVLDAIAYVARRAEEMGVPAVINLSYSRHIGPHDGTDVLTRTADALLSSRAILVSSIGNDGEQKSFAEAEGRGEAPVELSIRDDSCWSTRSRRFRVELEIWSDHDDAAVEVSLAGSNRRELVRSGRVHGWTRGDVGLIVDARLRTSGSKRGVWMGFEGSCTALNSQQQWNIKLLRPNHKITGASAWVRSAEGVRALIDAPRPTRSPGFSSLAASPRVLSVGSYEILSSDGTVRPAAHSGYGRLPDGTLKPDLWIPSDVQFYSTQLKHTFTGEGTSASAALATRVVAWIWQIWPDAKAEQILSLLRGKVLCPDEPCTKMSMPNGYSATTLETLLAELSVRDLGQVSGQIICPGGSCLSKQRVGQSQQGKATFKRRNDHGSSSTIASALP